MKLRPLIQLALLSLLVMLASCNYATKLSDQLLPDAEYKSTIVKAETAMQSAEWAKAADLYEKAGQIKPGDWSLKLKQAEAYQNDGKLAQAFNAYQVIIDAKLPSNEINNEIVKKAKERQAKSGFKAEPAIVNVVPEPVVVETPSEEVAVTEQVGEAAPIQADVLPSITEAAAVAMETEIVPSGQGASDQVILDTLQSWITAWTSKNLPDYYAHYTKDFTGGLPTRAAWEAQRKMKIAKVGGITLTLVDVVISQSSETTATVSFKQNYASGNYKDTGQKTLEMKKIQGRWLISQEVFK